MNKMDADNVKKGTTKEETNNTAKDEVKGVAKAATRSTSKAEGKKTTSGEGKSTGKIEKEVTTKSVRKATTKGDTKVTKITKVEKPESPSAVKVIPRLKEKYDKEVVPALIKEMNYTSIMQVPRLKKIVVNIGLGEATQNSQAPDMAQRDLTAVAGQHPVITRAKKSISAFKLRQGMPIGVMVTLRANRMYDFFDRLVNVALPRSRDFQGVSSDSFDGRGNYTLGVREQTIFPEIDYSKVDKIRGMEISIVTSARTDEEGRHLLRLLGMPFATNDKVEGKK